MFMKTRFVLPIAVLLFVSAGAASAQIKKNTLVLPPVEGYRILKCDFHLHTIFSDGEVWPEVRALEAYSEGLDAIAITDHVENQRHLLEIGFKPDLNESFRQTQKAAHARGILLIPGAEISKDLPAGHYNALFIKDANAFLPFVGKENKNDASMIRQTLQEAKNQGAVVLWNHPWGKQKGGEPVWAPIQQELYEKGLFSGISVANGRMYRESVLDWCLEKGLTVYGNTDAHDPVRLGEGEYRNMTLVFARERSLEGIRQGLVDKMSVAYHRGMLFGREDLLRPILENSLRSNLVTGGTRRAFVEFKNLYGLAVKLRLKDSDGLKLSFDPWSDKSLVLDPFSEVALEIDLSQKKSKKEKEYILRFEAENFVVSSGKRLEYEVRIKL